jgi:hypothetical protein
MRSPQTAQSIGLLSGRLPRRYTARKQRSEQTTVLRRMVWLYRTVRPQASQACGAR